MRGRGWIPVLTLALVLAGCGDGRDASTPVVCLEGERAYERALATAPGAVRLDGETPLSECLAENQSGGDLATVGTALVAVATGLNAEARERADRAAALRLGYLVGAARRGDESSEGIHADLIRRLEAAARYSPGGAPLPPGFERAYRAGIEAGRESG